MKGAFCRRARKMFKDFSLLSQTEPLKRVYGGCRLVTVCFSFAIFNNASRSAQSLLKLDFARKISWSSPTLSPGPLPTHFLREKPWGRGWKFPPPPALLRNESWRHFKGMKNRSFYEVFLRRDLIGHVIDRSYHLFNNRDFKFRDATAVRRDRK